MIGLDQLKEVALRIDGRLAGHQTRTTGREAWVTMLTKSGFGDADEIVDFIAGYAKAVTEKAPEEAHMMIAKAATTMLCVGAEAGREDRG